jgi:hypothetical protein
MYWRRNPSEEQLLKILEEDYFDQPGFLRRKDLVKINSLRDSLGLPQVNAGLSPLEEISPVGDIYEIPATRVGEAPVIIDPFIEVRELYLQFLEKEEMMQRHKDYCRVMTRATASTRNGLTPIEPLATGGTNGGPILCDMCAKPFPLEGNKFNGITADAAWDLPHPEPFYSYIMGHLTLLTETNGTFRAYHGYENSGCGGRATLADRVARKEFQSSGLSSNERKTLKRFLLEEIGILNGDQRNSTIGDLQRSLFFYDPGVGINGPD